MPQRRSTAVLRGVAAAWVLSLALVLPATTAGIAPEPSGDSAAGAAAIDRPHVAGVVLVGFAGSATAADRVAARSAVGAVAARPLSKLATDAERIELGAGMGVERAVAILKTNPRVRYAEPDYLVTHQVTSNDTYYTNGSLWGMYGDASPLQVNQYGSGAAEAWQAGHTGSRDIVIGVIDEGIQYTHPDLSANIWTNPNEIANGVDDDLNGFVDDINGWDFFNNDASIYDAGQDAHGTHVSGTIGGLGGNGAGVAGVNWQVTIISAKFLGPGGGSTSGAILALDYLTDLKLNHGVNLAATSNSWGGGGFSQGLLDAINRSGDAGMLFVAAAGNSNANNDVVASYPSNYQCTNGGTRGWDCVVAVAAIDSAGARASFSSYGGTTVDLGAPGVDVVSTVPTNSYASYNGTSMATPHVSGAVALCASINPLLAPFELRNAVLASVTPTASMTGTTVTGGRLDVGAMVVRCQTAPVPVAGNPGTLTATTVSTSRIDLAWTDGVSNEAAWEIQRSPAGCGSFVKIGTIPANSTSYAVMGLQAGVTYCFRVRAYNSYGGSGSFSDWTNTASAQTLPPPPPYGCATSTYSWIDATSGGTARSLTDDSSVSVSLPFSFPFNGSAVSSVQVSSNGYLRFGSGAATAYANASIPSSADPNGFAAAFWDDLNPGVGGTIWTLTVGSAPNRQFVAAWVGVPHFSVTGSNLTFEIILEEATGAIVFQYQDVIAGNAAYDNGASASVGVENADGTAGTQISFNSASLANLSARRCTNDSGPTPPTILTTSLPDGTIFPGYVAYLDATGGALPYTWAIVGGSLPSGLTLDTSSGAIGGTPTAVGTWAFTVQVRGQDGASSTRDLSIRVANPLVVTTSSVPNGNVGSAYSTQLAASGGQTPYSWRLAGGTSLPPGLTLSTSGVISGTPTTPGAWSFIAAVTDAGDPSRAASATLAITVNGPPPGSFNKLSPKNNAKVAFTGSLTLRWGTSFGASEYQYCISTTNGSCTNWVSAGTATSVVVNTLSYKATYWWQVRAVNGGGTTLANNGTWWRFSTR